MADARCRMPDAGWRIGPMRNAVIFQEQVEVPLDLQSLSDFRRWAVSDDFPDRGRIDYIAGRIEVDMSPEDLFCHGTLKTEVVTVLGQRVKTLGHLFTDSTRVSCANANLSAEPDIVFVATQSIVEGRVRLIPKQTGEPGRYIELEGAPDLVVEIVSDASVNKDTYRLPRAYDEAGVREFWLADARGETMVFQIHRPGKSGYEAAEIDAAGFQLSTLFSCRFRLDRRSDPQGWWRFDLRSE